MWVIYLLESLVQSVQETPEKNSQSTGSEAQSPQSLALAVEPPNGRIVPWTLTLISAYAIIKILQWVQACFTQQTTNERPTGEPTRTNSIPNQRTKPKGRAGRSRAASSAQANVPPRLAVSIYQRSDRNVARRPSVSQANAAVRASNSSAPTADRNSSRTNGDEPSRWNDTPSSWETFELDATDLHFQCIRARQRILYLFCARVVEVQSTTTDSSGATTTEEIRTKLRVDRDPRQKASKERLNVKYMRRFWETILYICRQGQRLYEKHHAGSRDLIASKTELERIKAERRRLSDDLQAFVRGARVTHHPRGRPSKPLLPKLLRSRRKSSSKKGPVVKKSRKADLSSSQIADIRSRYSPSGEILSTERLHRHTVPNTVASAPSSNASGENSRPQSPMSSRQIFTKSIESRSLVSNTEGSNSAKSSSTLDLAEVTKALEAYNLSEALRRRSPKSSQITDLSSPLTRSTENGISQVQSLTPDAPVLDSTRVSHAPLAVHPSAASSFTVPSSQHASIPPSLQPPAIVPGPLPTTFQFFPSIIASRNRQGLTPPSSSLSPSTLLTRPKPEQRTQTSSSTAATSNPASHVSSSAPSTDPDLKPKPKPKPKSKPTCNPKRTSCPPSIHNAFVSFKYRATNPQRPSSTVETATPAPTPIPTTLPVSTPYPTPAPQTHTPKECTKPKPRQTPCTPSIHGAFCTLKYRTAASSQSTVEQRTNNSSNGAEAASVPAPAG